MKNKTIDEVKQDLLDGMDGALADDVLKLAQAYACLDNAQVYRESMNKMSPYTSTQLLEQQEIKE